MIYSTFIGVLLFPAMLLCALAPAASLWHTTLANRVDMNSAQALFVQKSLCSATGDLEIVPFESKVFPVARSLRVLLPSGYHEAANQNRKYPVLYLNDGQDLFDVCTSLFNREEWRVDETVNDLIATDKLPPLIVVGIDNAGKRLRPKEYLPYVDDTLTPPELEPLGELRRYLSSLLAQSYRDGVIRIIESLIDQPFSRSNVDLACWVTLNFVAADFRVQRRDFHS
jgi:hypothetical protein